MFVGTSVTAFSVQTNSHHFAVKAYQRLKRCNLVHVVAMLNLRRSQCLQGRTEKITCEGAYLFCDARTSMISGPNFKFQSTSVYPPFSFILACLRFNYLQLASYLLMRPRPQVNLARVQLHSRKKKTENSCCNTSFSGKPLSWWLFQGWEPQPHAVQFLPGRP